VLEATSYLSDPCKMPYSHTIARRFERILAAEFPALVSGKYPLFLLTWEGQGPLCCD
jgi:hypothetical protein